MANTPTKPAATERDDRIPQPTPTASAETTDHYTRALRDAEELPLIDPETRTPIWAANLQKLTARSGLTQAEIARRAGLNRDAYGRYCLGKTRPPAPKLIAIAKVLGARPEEIDPDRDDLEEAALRDAGPAPFRITPARGDGANVFLEISAELDITTALKIVEMMVRK